jgi:hypothetical protein
MLNIENVVTVDNVITANVDGKKYYLEFDFGDTLCCVLIDDEEVDYDEDVIDMIIDKSFE